MPLNNQTGKTNFDELLKFRKYTFRSHCRIILSGILEKWSKNILAKKIPPKSNKKEEIPIIIYIEDRIDTNNLMLLRFSILNTLIMCRLKLSVIIYTTKSKLSALEKKFENLKAWVKFLPIENELIENINMLNFNNLLKNSSFWNQIPSKSILMMQTDAILIEPLDFSLFKYDYIGAPWSSGKYISSMFHTYSEDLSYELHSFWESRPFSKKPTNLTFGNGGLSIRNTEKMAFICDLETSYEGEPEDVYFSRSLRKYGSNLPTINEARRFSCETDYFESIGSHASYLYLKAEEQAKIYERHFIQLIALIEASSKNN
tara:strand:+ start:1210 stop:2157 length:948 start_codon:yes stop_codon:yes gene_type:complete